MKLLSIYAITLLPLLATTIQAQVLYSRQPFGSTVLDSYQLTTRSYYSQTGEVTGPFPVKYPVRGANTNTAIAFTTLSNTAEKILLTIGQKNWLDLTTSVEIIGTGISSPRILSRGVDRRGETNQMTYVVLELTVQANAAPGTRTIRLKRPSLTGTDFNSINLNLQNNYRILYQGPFTINGASVNALQAYNTGSEVRFSIEGQRLHLIRGVRNTGNTMQSSIIHNLRLVERSSTKLVFACNFVDAGRLTMKEFISRYLSVESGAVEFNLNCPIMQSCTFIKTEVETSTTLRPTRVITYRMPSDAERGIQ